MLRIAWSTLRTRWLSFVGTFVALALGAALMAALGQVLASSISSPDRAPQRYAAAPVVVAADEQLRVTSRFGASSAPLAEPRGLAPELAARFPDAVVDRVFPAQLAGGPAAVGRPWSAARTAPQELVSGRVPTAGDEIVVTGGASVGQQVSVVTATEARTYRVVGLATAGPQPTVFFSDSRAAELSPRIDALALWASPTTVRTEVGTTTPPGDRTPAVSTEIRVLTGQDRALLDPFRAADEEARNNANTIVGIAAGFAAFIAMFVVSSTFAFAVGQRQREFALLRTTGATAGQVRRMVYGEALLVAVTAAALGALTGPLATRPILDWLSALGMAPDWLVPSTSSAPSSVAFGTGVLVALLGVVAAARRAGRVRPAEAMRESALEPKAMTIGRWLAGGGLLTTAVVSMVVNAVSDPAGATNNKTFMPIVMLLIAAGGLLAPVVVRPVTRLLAVPFGRSRGAGGLVVSAGALASTRRTAATAAPVMVTVALAATLLGAAAMTDATRTAMRTDPVRADYVVLPTGAAGLDRQLVDRLRAVPGTDVTPVTPTSVYTLEGEGTQLVERTAEAVDPATLAATLSVPVTAGDLRRLRDDTIAVSTTWEVDLGQRMRLWRADGSQVSLTVVALLGPDSVADAYLTQAHALSAAPSVTYVTPRPGADGGEVREALAAATNGHNARAVTRTAWAASVADRTASASRLGLLAVLGIMLGYTVIALVNTLLMAASDRAAERGALRLLGATRPQILRYVVAEALLVVAVGVVLAAVTTAVGLLGLHAALTQLAGPGLVDVPWEPVTAVIALCVVLAALAAALPASRIREAPIART